MPAASEASSVPVPAFERRLESILTVAALHRVVLPLDDLSALLPSDAPGRPADLALWIAAHPEVARLGPDGVRAADAAIGRSDERAARAQRFLREAEFVVGPALAAVRPLLRSVAVTGSTAYGAPESGDDLDFLAITRPGALWCFLLYAYLAARFRPPSGGDRPSEWCFNLVLSEDAARTEFQRGRGFLFAREAVTARPVLGAEYYWGLISASPGIRAELPRLLDGVPEAPAPRVAPAPLLVRIASALLYPWMAAYLQAVGLVRNARLRGRGEARRSFRVVAQWDRLAYETEEFGRLAAIYGASAVPSTGRS